MKHDYNGRLDATTEARSTIGFAQAQEFGGSGIVQRVVAEQESAADASFNVFIDGASLFAGDQVVSTADTPETFQPSGNVHYTGASVAVEVDINASSGTTGSLIVGVLTDDGRGPGEYS